MDEDTRNMKRICSLLHDLRYNHNTRSAIDRETLMSMIETAEVVYEKMKEEGRGNSPF